MTRTVSRLFDSYSQAQAAVEALEQAGFTSSEISLVSRYRDDNTLADDEVSSTATGATAGALVGGGGGLLAALGLIAIPGIGPLGCSGSVGDNACGCCRRLGCGRFDRRAHECRRKRGRCSRVLGRRAAGEFPCHRHDR